jgi:PAS domain S-box-containing protein
MVSTNDKPNLKILTIIAAVFIALSASYICLANDISVIYQNIFYIPILLSCFWYGKKGFIFSVTIVFTYFLFSLQYSPENIWEELIRLIIFISIALTIYKLAGRIKAQQLKITHFNKMLKNAVERFGKIEMLSNLGSYEVNLKTGEVIWSDELFKIFGYQPGSIEPKNDMRIELTHPEDRNLVKTSIESAINEKSDFKLESRIVRPDGSIRWVLSIGFVEYSEYNEAEKFIGSLLDITDQKLLERSLETEKEKFKISITSIGEGVIATDINARITILNQVAERLTGWTQEEALGKPMEEVFNIINESTGVKCDNPIQKVIESGLIVSLANHTVLISKDGTERSIADSAAPIKDNDGNVEGIILVFSDITEEKRRQDPIYYMRGDIINTILNTLLEKNPREERHSKRVSDLCQRIGSVMGLSEMEINKLKISGLLHDIGKIAIDDRILSKKGKLTSREWEEVKRHPEIGYRILNSSSEMMEIAQYVLAHHERCDGTGYPIGLKREEIPLLSRIIAVADSYDAMTSERTYKGILDQKTAIEELIRCKGSQFDPYVVDVFIDKILKDLCGGDIQGAQ